MRRAGSNAGPFHFLSPASHCGQPPTAAAPGDAGQGVPHALGQAGPPQQVTAPLPFLRRRFSSMRRRSSQQVTATTLTAGARPPPRWPAPISPTLARQPTHKELTAMFRTKTSSAPPTREEAAATCRGQIEVAIQTAMNAKVHPIDLADLLESQAERLRMACAMTGHHARAAG